MKNKLVIVGNGFDLAHGLKTTYRDFLNWYIVKAFHSYCGSKNYTDCLVEFRDKYSGIQAVIKNQNPKTFAEALTLMNNNYRIFNFKSIFFKELLDELSAGNWVDIELNYFRKLKDTLFTRKESDVKSSARLLNEEFKFISQKLGEYMAEVNRGISESPSLFENSRSPVRDFFSYEQKDNTLFLNFNYTETLERKYHIDNSQIIHIHGRALELERNPIIFGYGDESDKDYQKIEDLGENFYLDHFKSFGYFKTQNYRNLLGFIDSNRFDVAILGHSCGLSDRVLLNEIFEHENCLEIEIFYHVRQDGSDNFKETTQEISRHFKAGNKNMMRRKLKPQDARNKIPQVNSNPPGEATLNVIGSL